MRIQELHVSNYRALRDSSLKLGGTTALIGENNSGKSAFLQALDLFFSSSPKVRERDFSDGNTNDPIEITIQFSDFTPSDTTEFGSHFIDGRLVVTRRFLSDGSKDSGKFFVSAKVNPKFSPCRNEENKTQKRTLYKQLQAEFGLPNVSNADEIEQHLLDWETSHQGSLETEKLSGFKGWTNVAVGKLRQKTDFIFIRAVEDAEAIQQDKNSPVRTLINTIARQTIENSSAYKEFVDAANAKITELTDPSNVPVLNDISHRLTGVLANYYKDSAIHATWDPITQIQPSFPTANIEIVDNKFTTTVDSVGHGLQRAVILTVLQFMAEYRAAASEDSPDGFTEAQSDIVLAIEEPEIYQHPTKQRLFAKLLKRLAASFNEKTGIRIQVIYVTHSPLMISLSECEVIRMVRRIPNNVAVGEIDLAECARRSALASGRTANEAWSGAQYGAKLHTFRSETAEGFFGRCVVLVEGVGDKAILEASYKLKDRDPHAEGIVILDVTGKNNLDKPIVVFSALNIPCFWIFDNDRADGRAKSGSIKANRILQVLGGIEDKKCEDWPQGVFERFAAWNYNLEEYVKNTAGDAKFQNVRDSVSSSFDIDADTCLKFPAASTAVLLQLKAAGFDFPELDEILLAIDHLTYPVEVEEANDAEVAI